MIVVFLYQSNGTEIHILSKGRCLKQTKKNETYTPPKIIFFLLSMNKINGHEI